MAVIAPWRLLTVLLFLFKPSSSGIALRSAQKPESTGVNPDPAPYQGKVVIDGDNDDSLVKVYNKDGAIVFRKELHQSSKNLQLNSAKPEWILLRSIVGLDNVIDVELTFHIDHETGLDTQKFWFEGGMLRNKGYPGKVVGMVPIDNDPKKPFELRMEDEVETNDRLYWIYNCVKNTFENGYLGDRYLIFVTNGDFTSGNLVDVHKPSGQNREQFDMPAEPFPRELEILSITYDLNDVTDFINPVALYRMTNLNNSPIGTTVTINQEEIKTSVFKEIFYWKDEWVVDKSFSMNIAVPKIDINLGIHLGLKETKTVGSNSLTENTVVQKWNVETPIPIPPYSEVIFNMLVQQGQISVPFTASMRKGKDVWEEKGTYEGVDFFSMEQTTNSTDLVFGLTKNGTVPEP